MSNFKKRERQREFNEALAARGTTHQQLSNEYHEGLADPLTAVIIAMEPAADDQNAGKYMVVDDHTRHVYKRNIDTEAEAWGWIQGITIVRGNRKKQ